jgi:hypothetical protein
MMAEEVSPPRVRRSRLGTIATVAAAVALVIVAAVEITRPLWFGDVEDPAAAEHLAALDRRLGVVENGISALKTNDEKLNADLADIRNRLAALEKAEPMSSPEVAALTQRLQAMEKEMASLRSDLQQPAASSSAEVAALNDRIAALEARTAQPSTTGPAPADAGALERLAAENAGLREQVAALAAQLESLKTIGTRLDALDRALAARGDDGGATLVLAVSNLGAALATSRPFATELGAVTQIAASDAALAAKVKEATAPLVAHAAAGIPTLHDLRGRFAATARAVVSAAQAAEPAPAAETQNSDWFDRQLDWLSSAADSVLAEVSVRPVGDVPGDAPEARVARAEVRLTEGALAAAVDELAGLSAARARLAVDPAMAALQAAIVARGTHSSTSDGAGG